MIGVSDMVFPGPVGFIDFFIYSSLSVSTPSIDVPVVALLTSLLFEIHAEVSFAYYLSEVELDTVQDQL